MNKQALIDRITNWMRGRNGADALGNFVLGISVLLLVVNIFTRNQIVSVLALAAALYACWRTSSKNLARRRAENRAFLRIVAPVASWVRNPKASFDETRTYRHLTCPNCGQKVRVPRGKGKIRVTCPSCHQKFDARS